MFMLAFETLILYSKSIYFLGIIQLLAEINGQFCNHRLRKPYERSVNSHALKNSFRHKLITI